MQPRSTRGRTFLALLLFFAGLGLLLFFAGREDSHPALPTAERDGLSITQILRLYSIFAGFYDGLRGACIVSYRLGSNIRTRKAKRCLVRVRIDPIPPKGLPRLQTCHRQSSSTIAAMTSGTPVHAVGTQPIGTSRPSGRCTTWGISTCGVRGISWSPIPTVCPAFAPYCLT